MRPLSRWEKFLDSFIWGDWSYFTGPHLYNHTTHRVFVISKLKIRWNKKENK